MLLTSAAGQCIRFAVNDACARIPGCRTSMGVRGINLGNDKEGLGDKLISLRRSSRHVVEASSRRGGSPTSSAPTRCGAAATAEGEGTTAPPTTRKPRAPSSSASKAATLSCPRPSSSYSRFPEKGLRQTATSSYEYRTTGRGGKGIVAMAITEKIGRLVASFPVEESDQIMLVTNGGQLICCLGQRHPHRRPLDARRHRVLDRRRREGGFGGAVDGRGRRGERGGGKRRLIFT